MKLLTHAACGFIAFFLACAANATVVSSDIMIQIGNGSAGATIFLGAEDDSAGALVTTFDDESSNVFTGSGPFPADMQPNASMSIFNGLDIFATWHLRILDDYSPGDGDNLLSWSIFGTLDTGAPFDFNGPAAFNVDTNPYSKVEFDVTDHGDIADLNLRVEFGSASIPEPATLALMALGLAGLGLSRKRKTA